MFIVCRFSSPSPLSSLSSSFPFSQNKKNDQQTMPWIWEPSEASPFFVKLSVCLCVCFIDLSQFISYKKQQPHQQLTLATCAITIPIPIQSFQSTWVLVFLRFSFSSFPSCRRLFSFRLCGCLLRWCHTDHRRPHKVFGGRGKSEWEIDLFLLFLLLLWLSLIGPPVHWEDRLSLFFLFSWGLPPCFTGAQE